MRCVMISSPTNQQGADMTTEQVQQVIATIYFMDDGRIEEDTYTFPNEKAFRKWAKEELQWESTHRISCKAINYDEKGMYSAFHGV